MLRTALWVLSFLFAAAAQAQVYKCVDPGGKITYSQNPCPAHTKSGSISRRIDSADSSPAPAEAAEKGEAAKVGAAKNAAPKNPKNPAEQEQAFRKRQQDQAKAQKEAGQKAAQTRIKEANCRNARERLAQYEIGGRITRTDAQGQRYYLDDNQIAQQSAQARADVAQHCS